MNTQCSPPPSPGGASSSSDPDGQLGWRSSRDGVAEKVKDASSRPPGIGASMMSTEFELPPEKAYGLNRLFFKRAWALLGLMFPNVCAISVFELLMLVLFCGAEQYVVYWVGIIPSQYYKVLGDKDLDAFGHLTAKCMALVCVISFIKGSRIYISTVLYVSWRQLIDRHLHRRYFTGVNYYLLNVLDSRIDNPDQRITQDVDKLCKTLSTMLAQIITSPFIIGYYTYSVYINAGYIGVLSIYGFFVVATLVNRFAMTPIVTYVVKQEEREGTFRFKHMQIRVHAEALGLHGSAAVEQLHCNRRLGELISTLLSLQNRRFLLTGFVNLVDYTGSILNYLVISIPIFAGLYDDKTAQELSALISRNSFICMYLVYNFTQLVDLAGSATDVIGVTHRVGQLMERMDLLQQRRSDAEPPSCETTEASFSTSGDEGSKVDDATSSSLVGVGSAVENAPSGDGVSPAGDDGVTPLSGNIASGGDGVTPDGDGGTPADVTCDGDGVAPDDDSPGEADGTVDYDTPYTLTAVSVTAPGATRPLISDLSLSVGRHRSLLITGSSSCGKTSLLRVLRGLWLPSAGEVVRRVGPGTRHVFFMPQRPFLTDGSLRQQMVYPEAVCEGGYSVSDSESMWRYLELTELTGLVERCGGLDAQVEKNWYDMLSPGEMQRLCFLRLFYHRPQFVFMDEATSAVSPDMEEILYRECRRLHMTLVSVGHRESLVAYHDWKLHFLGDGGWRLDPIGGDAGDI